jgi:hypothetical protein
MNGLVHETKSESSMLHSNCSTASILIVENSNLIEVKGVLVPLPITRLLPSVVEVITVSGRFVDVGSVLVMFSATLSC